MAVRQVNETDSLDKLRVEFNAIANDFGGYCNSFTNSFCNNRYWCAVNEINNIAIAKRFILSDGLNTRAVAS